MEAAEYFGLQVEVIRRMEHCALVRFGDRELAARGRGEGEQRRQRAIAMGMSEVHSGRRRRRSRYTLAARQAWRRVRCSPVALRHRLSAALL